MSTHNGYTLVEILVSIAIMSIMLGIVGFSYSLGKNYDSLNLENQRLASAIRNVRNRDFNGVVAYNGTVDAYPLGGYGLHIEHEYSVCSLDATKSCYAPLDCSIYNAGDCTATEDRSSYVIFADFSDDHVFDGGKTGNEYVDEFKIAKNLRLVEATGANEIDIMFKAGELTVYLDGIEYVPAQNNPLFSIETQYWPSGTAQVCGSQTRDQKGRVSLNLDSKNLYEELVACP